MKINDITSIIIEESIYIHKKLGPGLFESVYEEILAHRLVKRGLRVDRQVGVPVIFEDIKMNVGFRADLIIEAKVLIEIKSLDLLPRIAEMQVMTYLRLTNIQIGLLINFNTERLVDGVKRIANSYIEEEFHAGGTEMQRKAEVKE
jgi:GxxExxY protein